MSERNFSESRKAVTIITTIFDWDDTLLPTSVVSAFSKEENGKEDEKIELSSAVRKQLAEHDDAAKSLVDMFGERGEVRILTNGQFTWILHSAETYIPKTYKSLKSLGALEIDTLFSAYDFHHGQGDVGTWKLRTVFEKVKPYLEKRTRSEIKKNNGAYIKHHLISIGDSLYEKEAIIKLSEDSISSEQSTSYRFVPKTVLIGINASSISALTKSLKLINTNRKVLFESRSVNVTLDKKAKKKDSDKSKIVLSPAAKNSAMI